MDAASVLTVVYGTEHGLITRPSKSLVLGSPQWRSKSLCASSYTPLW